MNEPNLPCVLLVILVWLVGLTLFVSYWAGRTKDVQNRLAATTKKKEDQ